MSGYVDIRIDKATGEITVRDSDAKPALINGIEQEMPLTDIGDGNPIKSLEVAVIYSWNPGCVWIRGRLYCW